MTKTEMTMFILATTYYTAVYAFFVIAPFRTKLRFSMKTTMLCLGGYTLATLYLFWAGFDRTSMIPGFLPVPLALWLVLTVGVCFFCIQTAPAELLFSIFIILNVQANVLVISKVFRAVFLPDGEVCIFRGSRYLVGSAIFTLIFIPMMYYLFMVLLKKVVEFHIEFRNWRYLWTIPMMFFVNAHLGDFGGIARDGAYTGSDLLVLVLSNVVSYVTAIVCLKMLIRTHESLTATERAHVMEQQLRVQKTEYGKLTERIDDAIHQRHDLRHHFMVISGLLEDGNEKKAREYLSQYFEENLRDKEPHICAHVAADHILRHFVAAARAENAEITCRVHLPADLGVADMDLCVVLGNLLENAVLACKNQAEGRRYLTVQAEVVGRQLILSVENSYSGKLEYRNGIYYSTKHRGEGIGLSSVREVAEHSGGSFTITAQDGVFQADVLLNF
ncbi:MAG: GHKL domain-containing protein [Pseudoflavonifractor sp.]